jgi:hypothetical protein
MSYLPGSALAEEHSDRRPGLVSPREIDVDVFFDDADGLSVAEMAQFAATSGHGGDAALLMNARGLIGLRGLRVVHESLLTAREPEPAVRRRHLRACRGGRSLATADADTVVAGHDPNGGAS